MLVHGEEWCQAAPAGIKELVIQPCCGPVILHNGLSLSSKTYFNLDKYVFTK